MRSYQCLEVLSPVLPEFSVCIFSLPPQALNPVLRLASFYIVMVLDVMRLTRDVETKNDWNMLVLLEHHFKLNRDGRSLRAWDKVVSYS